MPIETFKIMKTGDILKHLSGDLYQVLQILSHHEGIYKVVVIDDHEKKSIKYSYLFKGFEADNDAIDPIFIF